MCTVGSFEPWHSDGKDLHVRYTAGINKACDKLCVISGGLAIDPLFLKFIKAYSKASEWLLSHWSELSHTSFRIEKKMAASCSPSLSRSRTD